MRLIARFPNREQVGWLVDTLRNAGFDRKDMVISDLEEEAKWDSLKDALQTEALIQSEGESLAAGKSGGFSAGIKGLRGKKGIIVAVETPRHESDRVRSLMKNSGAVEIIQD